MANQLLDMSKVRKVLQLHDKGKSKLFISRYLSLSRNTVKKYIALYQLLSLKIGDINCRSDADLEELFSNSSTNELTPKLKAVYSFFPYMERELKKTGVTKHFMWEEYYKKHPDGLKNSQFKEHYSRWSKKVNPVMHMTHKSGDKMYIDYAGKTLQVVDKDSGEVTEVQFYVAILGASQYTYAEATPSQKKEDFISSTENALHHFNGVPAAIVPDNSLYTNNLIKGKCQIRDMTPKIFRVNQVNMLYVQRNSSSYCWHLYRRAKYAKSARVSLDLIK